MTPPSRRRAPLTAFAHALRLLAILAMLALVAVALPAAGEVAHIVHAGFVAAADRDDVMRPANLAEPLPPPPPSPAAESAESWRTLPGCTGRPLTATEGHINVPILMYHYVRVVTDPRDVLGYRLSVTPRMFALQMDYLARAGYHPVLPSAVVGALRGEAALPACPVVLTFDDGYQDFFDVARPVLLQHHFTAVSYVVSGFVGREGFLTWDEIREMDQEGFDIAAHTVHHVDLARSAPLQLVAEIEGSKQQIQAHIGHPVLDFAYPSGQFNGAAVDEVRAAGFESAVTTQPGSVHSLADALTWTRVRVSGGESLLAYSQSLGPRFIFNTQLASTHVSNP